MGILARAAGGRLAIVIPGRGTHQWRVTAAVTGEVSRCITSGLLLQLPAGVSHAVRPRAHRREVPAHGAHPAGIAYSYRDTFISLARVLE